LLRAPPICFADDLLQVQHYYPDIYIKSENKVIEVKSNYTFYKDYDKNILKKKACIKMGLDFEFMILD